MDELRKALPPEPCVIEIIERGKRSGPGIEGVIVPDDIRINGVSVLCGDEPVVVHEMKLDASSAVLVTLTVLARRVIIGAEND